MITICKQGRDSDFDIKIQLTSNGTQIHITHQTDENPETIIFTPTQAWNFLYSETISNNTKSVPTKVLLELADSIININSAAKATLPEFHLDDGEVL